MMEVVRCKNKEEAKKSAGRKLNQLFLSHQNVPVLFLSSGGSALELLDEVDISCLPKDLAVGVLDERLFVGLEDANQEQFRAHPLFAKLQERNIPFCDMFLQDCPIGKIIITQGVGTDGHTAGIFPFPEDPIMFQELFENKDTIAYDAEGKTNFSNRATVTLPFLRKVGHSVVYVVGDEKRNALERVLADEGTLYETPARIVREMQNVTIFTDIL